MNLGINGRKALVCASSRGLGRACAEALANEGVEVFINGRDQVRLAQTLEEFRQAGLRATAVPADVTTDAGRSALLGACPEADILINNNAGPSPRSFVELGHEDWLAGLEANLLAPLMLTRALLPGMRKRRFGRIINITSAMVKLPHPTMALSSGARAGLAAVMKGQSVDCARDNVTINNLLPFIIDTDRQRWHSAAWNRKGSPLSRRARIRSKVWLRNAWASRANSEPSVRSCAARTPDTSRGKVFTWTAAPIQPWSDKWCAGNGRMDKATTTRLASELHGGRAIAPGAGKSIGPATGLPAHRGRDRVHPARVE